MSTAKRKLLLIACSNRKVRTKGLLPAILRYDGINYRVIRKAMREGYFPSNVDIKILSAKFGLIDAETPIAYYDQKMDRERAVELHPQVLRDLGKAIQSNEYSDVFVDMGKVYLLAADGFAEMARGKVIVKYAVGGIGTKAKTLKKWLQSSAEYSMPIDFDV